MGEIGVANHISDVHAAPPVVDIVDLLGDLPPTDPDVSVTVVDLTEHTAAQGDR